MYRTATLEGRSPHKTLSSLDINSKISGISQCRFDDPTPLTFDWAAKILDWEISEGLGSDPREDGIWRQDQAQAGM